jgi:MFS transporter, LPLT family, lysophospholipid transporter
MKNKQLSLILVAQFLSAMADNVVLFVAIALLKSIHAPEYHIPLLQEMFLIPYVCLAPFVGLFADMNAKTKVMSLANSLKSMGVLCMLCNVHPFIGYGLIGVGATIYSPAKYGILAEILPIEKLVKANAIMESSTIIAILLGVVLGGSIADYSIKIGFVTCFVFYLFAIVCNLLTPKTEPEKEKKSYKQSLNTFIQSFKVILANKWTNVSLFSTSIFWGTGTTLRLLLVAWVPFALHINDIKTPAYLNATTAIGIALGAFIASKWISFEKIKRASFFSMSMGVIILFFAINHSLILTYLFCALLGLCGGAFVIPYNAILQKEGHESVGAGQAIAIQNFMENLTMIVFVGIYFVLQKLGLSIISITVVYGVILLFVMTLLSSKVLRIKHN